MSKLDDDDQEEEYIDTEYISILPAVIAYCESDAFEDTLDAFKREYVDRFMDVVDSKASEEECHKIEYTIIHMKYQALIEEILERLAEENGSSVVEFYNECKDALEGRFTPLFEEHEHKWFVEALLSWVDYEAFFKMMTQAAERKLHK